MKSSAILVLILLSMVASACKPPPPYCTESSLTYQDPGTEFPKVYIACDIQIAKWQEKPTFLDGCDFEVSPGSVLYVAAHNNAPYFQGCDYCHLTGRGLAP
jgi:hypothetical protein